MEDFISDPAPTSRRRLQQATARISDAAPTSRRRLQQATARISDAAPTSRRRLQQATARISRDILRKASWNGASALGVSLKASLD